jgi:hypothetical protein
MTNLPTGLALDRIPVSLRTCPQWVGWRYITRGGKQTKAPVSPLGSGLADSTSADTWGTFDQAVAACQTDNTLAGIGFVFTADDPYCGVDLDNCIDDQGKLKPWAEVFVCQLNSYCEISPSGDGVKVFLKANKPSRRCRKKYEDGEVEIYDRDRFFTVTGRQLDGTASEVNVRQEALDGVYHTVFGDDESCGGVADAKPAAPAPQGAGVSLDDDEIIRLASTKPKTGAKFQSLWDGNWNDHYNSASEADSSVVFSLAYYSKDASQLDRLFRCSGLMRPKWDEMHGAETYGEITIDKALRKVTKQYAPKPKRAKAIRPPAPKPINTELPEIIIDDRQLSDLTAQALYAIKLANAQPSIFVRSGGVVRVVHDEQGVPKIDALDVARMRCRLTEVANFFTLRKSDGGYVPVGTNPPKTLAENILAQTDWDLPALAGIARAPILRRDGTICTTPGYDNTSRLFYSPDPTLKLTPIPEYPCGEEVHACVDLLLQVINEFPFVDNASRANALAILFSILMRPVIDGHVPLAIVDAPMQGTGKTLLVSSLAGIAVGNVSSESIPSKENEDEWRKKITSVLMTASPFVLLDNIPDNTTLNSAPLAAALTSADWSDRVLGRSQAIRLPSRVVWVATGNNLRVAGDMPRRSYSIRLDANAERPWERTGFAIKGLAGYISTNRGNLLSAALTIIRAWYTNGQPKASTPPLGSFEEWSETIGSVLAFAGIDGFLSNLEQTQTVQDEDTQQWTAFFDAWWERFGNRMLTADDVCNVVMPRPNEPVEYIDEPLARALPEPLIVNRDRGEGAFKRSLGRHLSRLRGRVFSGRKLRDAGLNKKNHVRLWQLVDTKAPAATLFDMEVVDG